MHTSIGDLEWLSHWYQSNCDDEWEHQYGVRIGTLDNPGWSLSIDLTGTPLATKEFTEIKHDVEHETDWWVCCVRDRKFEGFGGPRQLKALIRVFREWASA